MSSTTPARGSAERLIPSDTAGKLVDSEHRGRYWWATQLARGRQVLDAGCGTGYGAAFLAAVGAARVVGIDNDPEAVATAQQAAPEAEFEVADVHALPFPDGTFELVTCFEMIEHVERQDEALHELRRVLRPDGVLAISSPNRHVYPPGNEHHVHEYEPEELRRALSAHFAHVRLVRQLPWLGSAIVDDASLAELAAGGTVAFPTRTTQSAGADEMFTLALASDAELPAAEPLVTFGADVELRWWHVQLEEARAEVAQARQAEEAASGLARDAGRQVLETESRLAREIAEHHLRHERLSERCAVAEGDAEARARVIADMEASISWRLTSPLRRLKRALG